MFAIAIHGGAGTLSRDDMSADQEKEYLAGLGTWPWMPDMPCWRAAAPVSTPPAPRSVSSKTTRCSTPDAALS